MDVLLNVNTFLQNSTHEEICAYYNSIATEDSIVCFNLTGEINIGMMMRTAGLFGINRVVILGKRHYDKRTAVGIHHYIPHERIQMTKGVHNEFIDDEKAVLFFTLAKEQYQVVFVEQSEGKSFPLPQLQDRLSKKPVMFVFGNESNGIPQSVLDIPDTLIVEIPQFGVGRSFNVSTACGMVLYERNRNRM